jgi:glycosyltransferase involved in cell wall biosynthesis
MNTEAMPANADHIAIVPGSIDGGGIGIWALNLAAGMLHHGVTVDLVLTSSPADRREVPDGVRTILLGERTRYAQRTALEYLLNERPNAVISARNYIHLLMFFARRMARGRVNPQLVWTFHTHRSSELFHNRLKDRALDALAMRLALKADHLVAVSAGVAQDLVEGLPHAAGKVNVIRNPAWSEVYFSRSQVLPDHPWYRHRSIPIIVGVGRLTYQKDFLTLIRAFQRMRSPARLLILGEGPDRPVIEKFLSDNNLSERVQLVGQIDNVHSWLRHANLLVLSSRWEGFGMVLVEALGLGLPVVATDCPSGPAEILCGGRHGRLVPVGDIDGLSDAMELSLRFPCEVDSERIRTHYGVEEIALDYLRLLSGEIQ